MNRDEERSTFTFADVYRLASRAGGEECPPFDVECGLGDLQGWIDREVEIVPEHRAPELEVPETMESPRVELRGRHDLLDELLTLTRCPQRGPAVLVGVGGVGKSTVAAELAARVRDSGKPAWWVSAADPASLSSGLATVARQLGGSSPEVEAIAQGAATGADRFWRLLDRAPDGWLLVFDNADDPWVLATGGSPAGVQNGTGWVRSSRRGLVLVTSRETDPRMWNSARLFPVGQLNEVDAAHMLRDLAPAAGDEDQARVLARRLGKLPLALYLAGAYLGSRIAPRSTFVDYGHTLAEASESAQHSGSVGGMSQRAGAVTKTAEISLDGLASRGVPQARAVLRLASCYAPTTIPVDMLDSGSMAALLSPEADAADSGLLMTKALTGLRTVGLVQKWPVDPVLSGEAISIHPVVSDSNRVHLDEPGPDADTIRHIAVDLLVAAVNRLRFDRPEHWPHYRLLGHHLLALLETTAPHVDHEHRDALLTAAAITARAFNRGGAGKAANALCQIALTRCSELGQTHPAALRLRHQLAWAIANQGHLSEAEEMYRETLRTRLHVLGRRHPETVESLHEYAWISACQGRWFQAETRYRRALRASLEVVGSEHPATLTTRHELAWVIAHQDRLDEAHAAFVDVLRDRGRVLGQEHPQTLATRHEIAWITASRGEWAEAEAVYRDLLHLRRRILDADHPETLLTAHELAWTLARQDRLAEARSLYEQVLERRRRSLGDDHPETATTVAALEGLERGEVVDAEHIV